MFFPLSEMRKRLGALLMSWKCRLMCEGLLGRLLKTSLQAKTDSSGRKLIKKLFRLLPKNFSFTLRTFRDEYFIARHQNLLSRVKRRKFAENETFTLPRSSNKSVQLELN